MVVRNDIRDPLATMKDLFVSFRFIEPSSDNLRLIIKFKNTIFIQNCQAPGPVPVKEKDLERHYNQTGHHHHHPTTTTNKLFEALTIAFMMLGRNSTLTNVIKNFWFQYFF